MKQKFLFGYQLVSGLSDTATGALLILAPAFTFRLMHVQVPADAVVYVSWLGAFTLSAGFGALSGAVLCRPVVQTDKLETVWLLTGITRGMVSLFVLGAVGLGSLHPAWLSVAITDGTFAAIQFAGLARGWIRGANA